MVDDHGGEHPAGGMILIITYLVFALIGVAIAYFIGREVEARYPTWSLTTFLVLFLSFLALAWPIAVQATISFGPGWKARQKPE